MKFVVKTSDLKSMFSMVSSCIVEEKIALCQSMYIKRGENNQLNIRAMDNKHLFTCDLPYESEEGFEEAYIPFFDVNKFVSKFKNEKTTFTFKENDVLRVSSGKAYCQVSIRSAEESNFVSEVLNSELPNEITLPKIVIQNIKNKLNGIVDTSNNRPILNGICLDIVDNKLYFASSDGKKLAVYDTELTCNTNNRIVIPIEAINSFVSVCNSDNVTIKFSDKFIEFVSDTRKYFSTLINGDYPDYRRILNSTSNNNIEVQVKKNELIEALSFVNVLYDVNKKCEFSIKDKKLTLNFNNNESFEEIDIESEADFTTLLNSSFLEKMIKPLNTEMVKFKFLNANSPILIEADSIKMMLMPMRSAH